MATSITSKFNLKQWMSPQEYFTMLGRTAVETGLIKDGELRMYIGQFLNMRLSPAKSVQALEVIVKSRQERKDALEKTERQSKDSFMDTIINHKPKKK